MGQAWKWPSLLLLAFQHGKVDGENQYSQVPRTEGAGVGMTTQPGPVCHLVTGIQVTPPLHRKSLPQSGAPPTPLSLPSSDAGATGSRFGLQSTS